MLMLPEADQGGRTVVDGSQVGGPTEPPPRKLKIHALYQGPLVVYQVSGEIDSMTAPRLRDTLSDLHELANHMVVDLNKVLFLGSAGLSVLMDQDDLCRKRGITFSVVTNSGRTLRALRLTTLDRLITVYTSIGEAATAAGYV
jgi:anti-anti-sigma factor